MDIARQVLNLNINDVLPNRFQPRIRFSEGALAELTNSVKEHGVIQPITVRPVGNKYEIVAGERRYKASVLAGKETIPAIVVNLDDNSCAELALIENVQRQDLTPIEEAISYKKILDMGSLTQEALAIKLGKNQSTIANKLRLLNLDETVQNALLENRISERHARSLLKINNNDLQKQMLEKIINERLTVRRTDEEINKLVDNNQIENNEKVGESNNMNNNFNNMSNYQNETNQTTKDKPNIPTQPESPPQSIPTFNPISVNPEPTTTTANTNIQNPVNNSNMINNMNSSNDNQNIPVQNINQPTNETGTLPNIPTQPIEQPFYENTPVFNQPVNSGQEDQKLNIPNNSIQGFEPLPNNINNQNQASNMNPVQNVPTPEEVNRLIEQANQITNDFNIPNTPIEAPITNDIPTQNEIQANIIGEQNNEASVMPSFNNMEIQGQVNIPNTPIEENVVQSATNNINIQNTSPEELRPIKFFNIEEENPTPITENSNNMENIFNIQPEVSNVSTEPQVINITPSQPTNIVQQNDNLNVEPNPFQTPIVQTSQAQPEFIDNLEDQSVNMDFTTNQDSINNNFDFNSISNTEIQQTTPTPIKPTPSETPQVNIPAAPTISTTLNMPNFITDEPQELTPKMPEVKPKPFGKINIRQAIDEIRSCTDKIEGMGFNIDTEEYDLDNDYQIVIKIEKE